MADARPTADAAPAGDAAARTLLERAPRHPLHPEYFSSNTLFGQPGIYPGGAPMVPASGDPLGEADARDLLRDLLADGADDEAVGFALAWFDDAGLRDRVPDPSVRAALLLLSGGPAEPVLHAFLAGSAAVHALRLGRPDGEGRIVGRPADATATDDDRSRVVNERYGAEHPAVLAPSLAHALCHHGDRACNAEEATLHGLLAAVHTWWLSARPELARLGTELARRQASLTITLLNARSPGSPRASIRCPDGPGTIPGGNPALQCPDLWTIPFTSLPTGRAELSVPEPVRDSLARLAAPTASAPPLTYDDALGAWLTVSLGEGEWFGPGPRARAARALGLL
ncbi:MAG: hypothetical protein ACYC2O_13995 [Microthrixaceae bacterium]